MPSELIEAAERFGRFAAEFHDESDRGCAILVMCVLEETLQEMFKALLPEGSRIDYICPPGQFSKSLENAVALGLLSPRQKRSFEALVLVRKMFAHKALEKLSFESNEVSSVLKSVRRLLSYRKN